MRSVSSFFAFTARIVVVLAGIAGWGCESEQSAPQYAESLLALDHTEVNVRWTLVTPALVQGVVDGKLPFSVGIANETATWFDERRGRSLVLHMALPPSLHFATLSGEWMRFGSQSARVNRPPMSAIAFTEAISNRPDPWRLLAQAGHATTLPIFVRAVELAEGSVASERTGVNGIGTAQGALLFRLIGELLGILVEEAITTVLTPDCSGAGDTLSCQDCCDAGWLGHYESLKSCYLNCP